MSRIRTIKPELFTHEGLFEAEIATQLPLRCAFMGLFTCCDKEGRFRWEKRLKLLILPYDVLDFMKVLEALAQYGFIKKYAFEGEYYGCIPSWKKHQKIDKRQNPSELPGMEGYGRVQKRRTVVPSADEAQNSVIASSLFEPESLIPSDEVEYSPYSTLQSGPLTQNPKRLEPTPSQSVADSEAFLPRCVLEASVQNPPVVGQHSANTRREITEDSTSTRRQRVEDSTSTHLLVIAGREREGKGSPRGRALAALESPTPSPLYAIFEHWQQVMQHPQARLDPQRRSLIKKALKLGYSQVQLCEAISGCALTPHNLGHNDRGQRFDGLHVILRDADQIDRFRHNYQHPPRILKACDQQRAKNVQHLQAWIDEQQAGSGHETH